MGMLNQSDYNQDHWQLHIVAFGVNANNKNSVLSFLDLTWKFSLYLSFIFNNLCLYLVSEPLMI